LGLQVWTAIIPLAFLDLQLKDVVVGLTEHCICVSLSLTVNLFLYNSMYLVGSVSVENVDLYSKVGIFHLRSRTLKIFVSR
jgi:hypothetical protein